jgi:hypothetical protein
LASIYDKSTLMIMRQVVGECLARTRLSELNEIRLDAHDASNDGVEYWVPPTANTNFHLTIIKISFVQAHFLWILQVPMFLFLQIVSLQKNGLYEIFGD